MSSKNIVLIKKIIKRLSEFLLSIFLTRKKNIIFDFRSNIDYETLQNCGEYCKFLGSIRISSNVIIGKITSINGPGTRISSKINKIKIGNFCSIASGVIIQEYYHKSNRITSYYINQNIFKKDVDGDIISKGEIIIEDDVWIGANVIILSGICIGRGSIIGAGSVVTKNIPKYSIVAGNPAKVIRQRFSDELIEYLEQLRWWEWSIEQIRKNEYLFSLTEKELGEYFEKKKYK